MNCHADRITHEDGRATGVEATVTNADGSTAALKVEAPTVVVACGSLESPALLLRSGIGGPAVGQNLRLHPSSVVGGAYGTDQQAWWGPPQAGLCDEFADTGEGFGFLIETAQSVLQLDRVSSVDDVLLNTAGAGMAALASRRWWYRRDPEVERATGIEPA